MEILFLFPTVLLFFDGRRAMTQTLLGRAYYFYETFLFRIRSYLIRILGNYHKLIPDQFQSHEQSYYIYPTLVHADCFHTVL